VRCSQRRKCRRACGDLPAAGRASPGIHNPRPARLTEPRRKGAESRRLKVALSGRHGEETAKNQDAPTASSSPFGGPQGHETLLDNRGPVRGAGRPGVRAADEASAPQLIRCPGAGTRPSLKRLVKHIAELLDYARLAR
jgi:hypothetical protein